MLSGFGVGDRVNVIKGSYKGRGSPATVQKITNFCLWIRFDGDNKNVRVWKTSVEMRDPTSASELEALYNHLVDQLEEISARLREARRREANEAEAEARTKEAEVRAATVSDSDDESEDDSANESEDEDADDGRNRSFRIGDKVIISNDRFWHWSTRQAKATRFEGMTGTVTHVTECFVWVDVGEEEPMQKRKHNVSHA